MNRSVLDDLLQALLPITGERELVMVGSQSVHASSSDVPIEVVMSRECDLLLDESDPLTSVIDEQQRLVPFGPATPHLRCLEIHDLVLSKLAAGRLKDYELITVLLDRKLADLTTVRDRISAVPDLHMRAVLGARLQIVLEGGPR